MNVLILIIPITLALVGFFVWSFAWATRGGQFDDLETPKHRMLLDDGPSSMESDAKKGNTT